MKILHDFLEYNILDRKFYFLKLPLFNSYLIVEEYNETDYILNSIPFNIYELYKGVSLSSKYYNKIRDAVTQDVAELIAIHIFLVNTVYNKEDLIIVKKIFFDQKYGN